MHQFTQETFMYLSTVFLNMILFENRVTVDVVKDGENIILD